jgi:hypothetical protein
MALHVDVWKFHIFSDLSLKDLARSSRVCKEWHRWISDDAVWRHFDVNALFPKIKIECMDAKFWQKHVNFVNLDEMKIDLSNAQAITKRQIIGALARVKGAATATIVTMPQGYSTGKLIKLMKLYKEGAQIKMNVHPDPTFWGKGIEDTYVKKQYTFVAISEHRKNESFQLWEIEGEVKKSGLELAQIVEVATLNFFRTLGSESEPATYAPYAITTERGRYFPFTRFHRCVYVTNETVTHVLHVDCSRDAIFHGSGGKFFGVKRF